jgi:hypothetical protein
MKLAVNKVFMASSFDLEGRVSFDGPAELDDRPLLSEDFEYLPIPHA